VGSSWLSLGEMMDVISFGNWVEISGFKWI